MSDPSTDGMEAHLTGRGAGSAARDVGDAHQDLGVMSNGYCPMSQVIRAAELKGVRLLKSDLVNSDATIVKQGVVMFGGLTCELVDAIYKRDVSRTTIEEILQAVRSRKQSHQRIMDVSESRKLFGEFGHGPSVMRLETGGKP